jgi:hypothetical protein
VKRDFHVQNCEQKNARERENDARSFHFGLWKTAAGITIKP